MACPLHGMQNQYGTLPTSSQEGRGALAKVHSHVHVHVHVHVWVLSTNLLEATAHARCPLLHPHPPPSCAASPAARSSENRSSWMSG